MWMVVASAFTLAWMAIPLDDGRGEADAMLYSLAYQGLYDIVTVLTGFSTYRLLLPLPSPARCVLMGAGLVLTHLALTMWLIESRHVGEALDDDVPRRMTMTAGYLGSMCIVLGGLVAETVRFQLGSEEQQAGEREGARLQQVFCCLVGEKADNEGDGGGSDVTTDDDADGSCSPRRDSDVDAVAEAPHDRADGPRVPAYKRPRHWSVDGSETSTPISRSGHAASGEYDSVVGSGAVDGSDGGDVEELPLPGSAEAARIVVGSPPSSAVRSPSIVSPSGLGPVMTVMQAVRKPPVVARVISERDVSDALPSGDDADSVAVHVSAVQVAPPREPRRGRSFARSSLTRSRRSRSPARDGVNWDGSPMARRQDGSPGASSRSGASPAGSTLSPLSAAARARRQSSVSSALEVALSPSAWIEGVSSVPDKLSGIKKALTLTPANLRRMARAEGSYNTPLRTFFMYLEAAAIAMAGYLVCQTTTVVAMRYADVLSDTERGVIVLALSGLMYVMRVAIRFLLSSKRLRAEGEPAPHAVADAMSFAVLLMGLAFQRTLLGVVDSLWVVAGTLGVRLIGQLITGPGSLTLTWHRGVKRGVAGMSAAARCVSRCRRDVASSVVEPPDGSAASTAGSASFAGVAEDPASSDFLEAAERRLVVRLYSKLAEALSLASWLGYAAIYQFGWNREVAAFKDLEGSDNTFAHMMAVVAIVLAYEAVAYGALWWQAHRVRPWLWRRAIGRIIHAPRALQVALLIMAVHVVQDVGIAFVRI